VSGVAPPPEVRALLEDSYEAFNRRDIDAVLAGMTPDVDWPNAWEGGSVSGHEAVRDYWTRQWRELDPEVHPVAMTVEDDGRIRVLVEQTVRPVGAPEAEGPTGQVVHAYTLRDGLVTRMDVEPV
jgi:ketosteroid isomerase-like protein